MTLDFGTAFADGRKVKDKILERLPITLAINMLSLGLVLLIAIPIGVMSATRQYSLIDRFTTIFVFVGFSTPSFWLALLLIYLLRGPMGTSADFRDSQPGYDGPHVLGLGWPTGARTSDPARLRIGIRRSGRVFRYVRNNMLEVLRQDYIRTARAKGLPERDGRFTNMHSGTRSCRSSRYSVYRCPA